MDNLLFESPLLFYVGKGGGAVTLAHAHIHTQHKNLALVMHNNLAIVRKYGGWRRMSEA